MVNYKRIGEMVLYVSGILSSLGFSGCSIVKPGEGIEEKLSPEAQSRIEEDVRKMEERDEKEREKFLRDVEVQQIRDAYRRGLIGKDD